MGESRCFGKRSEKSWKGKGSKLKKDLGTKIGPDILSENTDYTGITRMLSGNISKATI